MKDLFQEYDELIKSGSQSDKQQIKSSLYVAADSNPDAEASLRKLSEKTGLPVEAIRADNGAEAKRRELASLPKIETLPNEAPTVAAFLADPENAKLAHDDIDNLSAMEKIIGGIANKLSSYAKAPTLTESLKMVGEDLISVPNPLTGYGIPAAKYAVENPETVKNVIVPTPALAYGQLKEGAGGFARMLASPEAPKYANAISPGIGALALLSQFGGGEEFGKAQAEEAQLVRRQVMTDYPLPEGSWQSATRDALTSILAQIPSIALGPEAGLASFFPLAAGSAFSEQKDAGSSEDIALFAATVQGVSEVLTEKIPFENLFARGIPPGKRLIKGMLSEIAGESVNQTVSSAVDRMTIKPGMTWEDFFTDLIYTAKTTTVQSFLMSGTASMLHRYESDSQRASQAKELSELFTALGDTAQAAKLRERLPEKLQELVAGIKQRGGIDNAYIPVERFQEYFQSQGINPAQALSNPDSYLEAVATGGDVAIPFEEFTAKFAGESELLKDVRLRPGDMTIREAEEWEKNSDQEAEKILSELKGAEVTESDRKIFDDVMGQLVSIGRERSTAEREATLMQSVFRTLGQRTGQDPFSLYERYKLRITRPLPEVLTKKGNVDTYIDPLLDKLRAGTIPSEREVFGPSLVEFLREKGVQDQGGELAALGVDESLKPFQKRVIREQGLPLDQARGLAAEAGYLTSETSVRDFLDAIDRDLRGQPVYSSQADQSLIDERLTLNQLKDYLESRGVDLTSVSNDEVRKLLQDEQGSLDYSQGEAVTDITETEAFKKWFGDSKVVDENGKPLVVYHGTDADIHAFAPEYGGSASNGGAGTRDSIFFAADIAHAEYWATNAVNTTAPPSRRATGEVVYPVYLKIETPLVVDFEAMVNDDETGNTPSLDDFRQEAEDNGNDGMIIKNMLDDESNEFRISYVVFSPEQIKSVFNRGTFDPNNPNILYQSAPTFKPSAVAKETLPDSTAGLLPSKAEKGQYYRATAQELQSYLDKHGDGFIYRVSNVLGIDQGEDIGRKEYRHQFKDGVKAKVYSFTSSIEDARAYLEKAEEGRYIVYRMQPEDLAGEFVIQVPSDRADKNVVHIQSPLPANVHQAVDVVYRNGKWEVQDGDDTKRTLAERRRSRNASAGEGSQGTDLRLYGSNGQQREVTSRLKDAALNELGAASVNELYQSAYHGSPHTFDKFTLQKIGTGEGAQAYGWGLYFASNKEVAEWYKEALSVEFVYVDGQKVENLDSDTPEGFALSIVSGQGYERTVKRLEEIREETGDDKWVDDRLTEVKKLEGKKVERKTEGRLYKVELAPKEEDYLDWDKPLSEQSEKVKAALSEAMGPGIIGKEPGRMLYLHLSSGMSLGSHEAASKYLLSLGIPGIRYLDGTSRGKGEGHHNYVIFDDSLVTITEMYQSFQSGNGRVYYSPKGETGMPEFKVKPPKKLYRGVAKGLQEDGSEGTGVYSMGKGLYSSPSKSFAAKYGDVIEIPIEEGWPRNPLVLHHVAGGAPQALADWMLRESGEKNIREFNKKWPDPGAFIRQKGYDGVVAGDEVVRYFDAELEQKDDQGRRGVIRFDKNRKFEISLLEKADLSTFLHESAHFYFEVVADLAEDPQAPQQVKEDFDSLLKWFGVSSRAEVTIDHHEIFARGFEAYLMEGKSPSVSLSAIFQRFKAWLTRIYRDLRNLDVQLTEEVRGVFDRLVATDEEIENAKSGQSLLPLFMSAADAGMSETEFNAYRETVEKANQEAKDRLTQKLMQELTREQKKWWKEEREKVKAEVEAEAKMQGVYQAFQVLTKGETFEGEKIDVQWKLSRNDLVKMYGEPFVKKLPRSFRYLYTKEGGVHPDMIAETFGFTSGDELVRQLIQAPPLKKYVEAETDVRMREKYGDMLNDGTIADEALKAVHTDEQGQVLRAELRALRKKQREVKPFVKAAQEKMRQERKEGAEALKQKITPEGVFKGEIGVPPLDFVKDIARKVIGNKQIKEIQPYGYSRAAAKAGREAVDFAAKGDYVKAADAKQKQMLNHYLFIEATKAREEADTIMEHMAKLSKEPAQKRIGKAGADYLDQINAILERYEFKPVSLKTLERRESLLEWVKRQEEMGLEPAIPEEVLIDAGKVNYKTLPVDTLRAIYDAVRNIEHLARLKNKLLGKHEKIEFEEARGQLLNAVRESYGDGKPLPIDKETRSYLERMGDKLSQFDASLIKMEQLVAWLDEGDIRGPWAEFIFRPIAEAQNRENDLTLKFTKKLTEILEAFQKETGADLMEKHYINTIGEPLTHQAVIAVALNTGNASNRDKLMRGYGWGDAQINEILSHMGEGDWKLVQSIWDTVEELWPDIADLEKRLTGLAPPRVEAREFTNQYGTFRGGYYPVVYDSRFSTPGEKQADAKGEKLFEATYVRATTEKGHTKARIEGAAYPIALSLEVLPQHISQVIHDISFREAVVQANRLINDGQVKRTVSESVGVEYHRLMNRWLASVANDRNVDRTGNEFWSRFLSRLRTNATIAAMGFKATTMFAQITGLSQSLDLVKGKYLSLAVARFSRHPFKSAEWVYEKSGEMKHRFDMVDRDVRDGVRKIMGKKGPLAFIQGKAFAGIGLFDATVTIPTWIGAYEQGKAEGLTEADAVAFADRAVRLSQGAGGAKDLSSVQRNNEMMKLFTMFYSYFNVLYNRLRDTGRAKKIGADTFADTAWRSFILVMVPAVMGELLAGRGPDDDEDEAAWAARKVALYPFMTVPFLRDIAGAIDFGRTRQLTPIATAFEKSAKLGLQLDSVIDGDKDLSDYVFDTVELSGYAFGLPSAQAKATGKYLWDVIDGEIQPEDVGDVLKGLVFGQRKGGK